MAFTKEPMGSSELQTPGPAPKSIPAPKASGSHSRQALKMLHWLQLCFSQTPALKPSLIYLNVGVSRESCPTDEQGTSALCPPPQPSRVSRARRACSIQRRRPASHRVGTWRPLETRELVTSLGASFSNGSGKRRLSGAAALQRQP